MIAVKGWSTNLNVGHLLQAEGPPALLRGCKSILRESGARGALDFFLLHALLDVAGVAGHVTLRGSPVLTEDLCIAFMLARDAVLLLQVRVTCMSSVLLLSALPG